MEQLASYFARLATTLATGSVAETMRSIVDAAVEVIDGCDHASVSYRRKRTLVTASSNDTTGPLLDALQGATDEGPCLDAIRTGQVMVSDDLDADPRWPTYGPQARARAGVRSSLALPLIVGDRTIGALNLFGTSRSAFDHHRGDGSDVALGAVLAAHATPALAAAVHREDMNEALHNRDLIGQAKGIVMGQLGSDADTAFALLVEASQRLNVKLVEVARRTAASGQLPDSTQV